MLKLAQREDALAQGIDLIEWTFDPLELKNAWFNIERLGAVVRRFVPNQYGCTTSPLHGGLPTDRCVAEWRLDSPRVKRVLAGESLDHSNIAARIEVPAAIGSFKRDHPGQAREIQTRVREEFLKHLSNDLAVTGFERASEAGCYLLEPWESE
jgi:predicted GNAT superfamily acetyltransferase